MAFVMSIDSFKDVSEYFCVSSLSNWKLSGIIIQNTLNLSYSCTQIYLGQKYWRLSKSSIFFAMISNCYHEFRFINGTLSDKNLGTV